MKELELFVLVSALAGLTAAIGSMAGAAVSHNSLFVGAIVGGVVGTYMAARVATLRRLIAQSEVKSTAIGGCVGFRVAAAFSVSDLHTPIIPILSAGLIAVGSLAGLAFQRRRKKGEDSVVK